MLSNTKIPPQSRQHTPSTFFALMIIVHPGSIQFTTFKIRVSIHPHNLLVSSKISIKSYKKPTRQCNSKNSHHTTVFNLPTTRAAFTKSWYSFTNKNHFTPSKRHKYHASHYFTHRVWYSAQRQGKKKIIRTLYLNINHPIHGGKKIPLKILHGTQQNW